MLTVPCVADWDALAGEVLSVPLLSVPDGSGSSHFDGPEGWINGLSNARIVWTDYPALSAAITELRKNVHVGECVQVMVNRLRAGASLDPHRDGFPANSRWHLPVVTHESVYWWDEQNGHRHMHERAWFGPVPYCGILHSVGNPSTIDRIHVVVDFIPIP